MNPTEIEFALRDLVSKPYDAETFPYDLIAIFNASKMTVSRLKSGTTNKATRPGDVLWQKNLFFRPAQPGEDVGAVGDGLFADPLTARHKPRFILVTNGQQVHVRDLKFEDTANVEFERLDEQSYFLLPLASYERRAIVEEHPADINAAKKLKKLYDAILAANPTWNSGHHSHELNLLMTRLLFCFYAEKTGIFDIPKVFTSTVTDFTGEDGSEVAPLLDRLFRIMNVEEGSRPKSIPASEARFPYVNGSLFEDTVEIPQFTRTARRQMLECGDLDWTTINPDIFGSMIQTVAQDGTRSDLGMHYTSVPNIMKVLQPLFLDELNVAFEKAKDSVPKLEALLLRLSKIRVFDPACGSGNFLIVAYKQLRLLEMQISVRLGDVAPNAPLRLSGILLQNFFGIDIVDFGCETAKLSLWIAEHQMNSKFKEIFGKTKPTLPLAKISTIRCGNALRLDWLKVCPPGEAAELYICSNPPYLGNTVQDQEQQSDVALACRPLGIASKELDYIAGWFAKAATYIRDRDAAFAIVATNSLCQGRQVALLWPQLLSLGLDISFAYASFKWSNNAANNAGVTCIIIGMRNHSAELKKLFVNDHVRIVPHISPYLTASPTIVVTETPRPISGCLPPVVPGSQPRDGGHFMLTPDEREAIIKSFPAARAFVRRYCGSQEFIKGIDRSCVWVTDDTLSQAIAIPLIAKRIEAVRRDRLTRGPQIRQTAKYAHRFRHITHRDTDALLIPKVSSERRHYLPIGVFDKGTVISEQAFAIYTPPPYLFSILSSRLHAIWAEAVSGKLENRLRYSSTLVYNTLPVPTLSEQQKASMSDRAKAILRARANHPGRTIAWLYDPDTMPPDLLNAHQENDSYIEECIYGRIFRDDTARLEHLFMMYARLNSAADGVNTLFAGAG